MQTCDKFWEVAFIAWAANNDHMEFVRALVVTLHLRLGAFQLSQLDSGPVTLLCTTDTWKGTIIKGVFNSLKGVQLLKCTNKT